MSLAEVIIAIVMYLWCVGKLNNCSKSAGTNTKQWHFFQLALSHVIAEHAIEVFTGSRQYNAVSRKRIVFCTQDYIAQLPRQPILIHLIQNLLRVPPNWKIHTIKVRDFWCGFIGHRYSELISKTAKLCLPYLQITQNNSLDSNNYCIWSTFHGWVCSLPHYCITAMNNRPHHLMLTLVTKVPT